MSVRPRAGEPARRGCCSRLAQVACERGIAAVKGARKRRERRRLREELDGENLVVKRNVVSTLDGGALGQVSIQSGEVIEVTSVLMFRPTIRERLRATRIFSLRNGTALVGNVQLIRGTYFPRPPLDVSASTSSGTSYCFDEGVERGIRFLVKKGSF